MNFIGLILCVVAGGMGYFFGGWMGLTAVIIGELGALTQAQEIFL